MVFGESHIHFIGIGGIGMSGIARMLLSEGKTISGSDRVKTSVTQSLDAAGARIDYEQAGRLPESADLVVISAAIKQDNPELVEARRRDINVQKYARVLGRLMAERRGIAVSGTHGKTTTTAMIATILQEAGLDPSFVVGAAVGPLGGSSHAGRGDLFVVEACEYDRSFHNLRPACAVINNVEEDHLDYYTNGIDEIVDSFATFASQVKPDGLLIVNRADANAVDAADAASCAVETFALNDLDADWTACGMEPVAGCYRFEVIYRGEDLGTFALGIPGSHNVANALAALACCRWAGVDVRDATEVLAGFHGADRRFQLVGNPGGVTVIDDYAHHPTEIRETLKGASDFFEARRIFVVFQPHQHSRTRFLLKDFARSFGEADVVLVPDIYFVRDSQTERQRVNSGDLVREVQSAGGECHYLPTFREIEDHLLGRLESGDVVITMGAGDVHKVGESVVRLLNDKWRSLQDSTC